MKKSLLFIVVAMLVLTLVPTMALAGNSEGMTEDPLLNVSFNLIDGDDYALANYIVTIDNDHQSVSNKNGEASFPAVHANTNHTFKIFTSDKKEVGKCNITFEKANKTDVSGTSNSDGYEVQYSTFNATIYIDLIVNKDKTHPAKASDTPLESGKKHPSATPTPKPEITDPVIKGYLIDKDGYSVDNATVQSKNNSTGKSLTGVTDETGHFSIPGITEGGHTLLVFDSTGNLLGDLVYDVVVGERTAIVESGGTEELDIRAGLGTIYVNIQQDGTDIIALSVSESELPNPGTAKPEPTEEPAEEPTEAPVVEEPTAEPTEAPTAEPAPEVAEDTEKGISTNAMIIIIVIIIAVVVVIIAVVATKRRR